MAVREKDFSPVDGGVEEQGILFKQEGMPFQ